MPADILVVDDDPSIRELLRLHLSNAGFAVRVAEDAVAAGHEVVRKRPDVLVCDVDMPYMNGFDFVAALREDPAFADLPVVFLTSIEDGAARGKELGAVGYLTKPVRSDTLLSMIAKAAAGARG